MQTGNTALLTGTKDRFPLSTRAAFVLLTLTEACAKNRA